MSYLELVRYIPVVASLRNHVEPLVALLANVSDCVGHLFFLSLTSLQIQINKGADMARGDDASTLKVVVVSWVYEAFGPSVPSLVGGTKDGRGLHNEHTGRLLCPCEFNWAEDEVRDAVRAGHEEYAVTADSWPIFCYADFSYDYENAEDGLWRSSLMVKAFKFIFTSPSSALDDKDTDDAAPPKKRRNTRPTTRQNVAAKIGLTSVTGRSIAYIAVQLCFALSSASSWSVHDSDFSYTDFYDGVVAYFEAPPGPIAVAHVALLLKWWNW
ncbi:hypothetical protein FIBSPDRAFT_735796 [Athelia psychrophila]|uniref:Uncharacterized protein n=1 Tax=Athelia psychrophila TaxID=1759441 RepID=A0A166MVV6_9AGAM|nr:hypothetical protein FIBSPDRAFT_735796 [Fibularhizoctonia sp. CBS 109695]